MMKFDRNKSGAFTLLELIVVMTISGILAATAVPAMMSVGDRRLYLTSHNLAIHVKFARSLAVSTGRLTWVVFDPATAPSPSPSGTISRSERSTLADWKPCLRFSGPTPART
jgi:prepilin-type N-terminal cleavage/methylation domain-containing protein